MAHLNLHLAKHDADRGLLTLILSGTCDKEVPLHRTITLTEEEFARLLDRAADIEEAINPMRADLEAAFGVAATVPEKAAGLAGRERRPGMDPEPVSLRIADDDGEVDLTI